VKMALFAYGTAGQVIALQFLQGIWVLFSQSL